ncbi:MAG: DUF5043 domain-containing protein [Alistipes sp.]|nr:DUF5043 domain-containing protein [Alistipes sp.]
MKKSIVLTVVLFALATASAQTNHYPNISGTVVKSEYTYKYRNFLLANNVLGDIELYNSSNIHTDVEWGHEDGTPLTYDEAIVGHREPYYASYQSHNTRELQRLVESTFTNSQRKSLDGEMIFVGARVDPPTGKIVDVYFIFPRHSPFVNISVDTYRSIELALKETFSLTSTAAGLRMNFFRLFWSQRITAPTPPNHPINPGYQLDPPGGNPDDGLMDNKID